MTFETLLQVFSIFILVQIGISAIVLGISSISSDDPDE